MIAAVAAACVRPTTLGVATFGRPEETTSATALPLATCVPPAGVCFFVASTRTNMVGRFPTVTAWPASACRSSASAIGVPLPSSNVTSTREPEGPRKRVSATLHAATFSRRLLSAAFDAAAGSAALPR